MDSLSQVALGAAVGIAVMRQRTKPWKAALIGGIVGTLPDLDNFYDYGDAVANMTLHRANSHALFWLTLASPVVTAVAVLAARETDRFGRWWLAVWLALVTHPLLDWFTIYGTQLFRPFTDYPYALGSIFIIDPLYTLPLLVGVAMALILRDARGWRWNLAGLTLGTLYLGWGVLVQQHVREVAETALRAQDVAVERLLVTPTPFNSILWRAVAMTPSGYLEGFYSLLDDDRRIAFAPHARGADLFAAMQDNAHVLRLARFSHGFFKMADRDGAIVMSDLRMGQEPHYSFNFTVGRRQNPAIVAVTPRRFRAQHDLREGLPWLWRRALGDPLPPPR